MDHEKCDCCSWNVKWGILTIDWLYESKDEVWKWNCGTFIWLEKYCCNYWWSHEKFIVFTYYKTWCYNSSHVNECVDVEHENNSLDYRPLMNVINQCKENSSLMSMSDKILSYTLLSVNEWVDVKPLERSNDQGKFMYSHDFQRDNFPLRHARLKVLKRTLVSIPDKVLRSMGQDLLKYGP